MANKKIFQIEINGLTEAVKSVDSLTEKIKDLQKLINGFKSKKIEIPIELGKDIGKFTKELDKLKQKAQKASKGVSVVSDDKEVNKVLQAREKTLKEVQQHYEELNGTIADYKKETKNLVAEQIKAQNQAKGYANTLNGLKAELKDLNSMKGDIDLGSEEYAEISDKILEITTRLKDLEAAQGTFSRDVGNYKNNIKDAVDELKNADKELNKVSNSSEDLNEKFNRLKNVKLNSENIKQYGISINDLKWKINQLEKAIEGMNVGTDEWKAVNQELLDLKQTLAFVERDMEAAVRAEDQLNTKIKLNINGIDLVFDDVNQGIGILEDKMYQLAAAGKQNTKEFKEIADAAAELKIQVKAVDLNIDNMVEGGKGINKMLSYFKGFSAIATAGTGISQLFGGDDEQAQKQMQTMTALIGVLEGVKAVQEEMAKGTDFGKMMQKLSDSIDNVINKLLVFRANIGGLGKTLSGLSSNSGPMGEYYKALDRQILSNKEAIKSFAEMQNVFKSLGIKGNAPSEVIKNLNKEWLKFQETMENTVKSGGTLSQSQKEYYNKLINYKANLSSLVKEQGFLIKETYGYTDALKALSNTLVLSAKSFWENVKACGTWLNQFNIFSKTARANAKALWQQKAAADGVTVGFKAMAKAMELVGTAAKFVRATLKAFLIFEAITFIMELFEWLKKVVVSIGDWALGNDKLVKSLEVVDAQINHTSKDVEKYLKVIDRLKKYGSFDEVEAASKKFELLSNATIKATKELQDYIKIRNKSKSLEDNLKSGGLTRWTDIDNIKEFKKEYQDLQKAVAAGVSIRDVNGGKWSDFWFTPSDAKSDLGEMQKRVIQDIEYQINNIDISKGKDELKKFFDILDDEMYSTSLANIEGLYPEEEWAKILKARIEQVRDMYEQMNDASDESADAQIEAQERIAQAWKEEYERQARVEKTIRDNNTQAIKDDYKRQMTELKNQRRDELDAAEGNLKVIASINAKYNRLELDAIEAHNKELEDKRKQDAEDAKSIAEKLNDALKKLRDIQLESEEESLEKHIKQLENQRDDEIDAAKENGVLVNELKLAIEKKYNKLIENERKKHLDYLNNLADEYARKQRDLFQALKEQELDNKSARVDIEYNVATGTSDASFDFNAVYGERIKAEKEFNAHMLQVELDYLKAKSQVEKDSAELDYQNQKIDEERRFQDQLKTLENFHKDGLLSEEEYNDNVEKEKTLHNGYLVKIEQDKFNKIKNINDNLSNEIKDKTSQSLTDTVGLYSKYADDVSNIMGNVGKERNVFGVLDYGKTKAQLDEAKELVKQGLDDIANEEKSLDDKLKNNEITFVDYKDAKEQLDETKKTLESEGKDITDGMKDLFKTVSQEWMGLANSWVSQISSLLSTMNDTQMILIDNQLAEIEHQLEIQQEAYDKAEEAAQKHKDKMDSIEDELKDSRGARRQFLIDVLASQQAAYLEDLKAQQDAEKEKEKLEKKQEALEKKRKEQEKKAKIQQAVINTFMAVSNALAVSPWFVGLALSAVALGLGMKNVAAIKSTPIYEDGGVIRGKQHRDGGVPIMGGRAEVEGGEFITNRKSTAANLPLLTMINEKKRAITAEDIVQLLATNKPSIKNKSFSKFENGGQLPNYSDDVNRVIQVANANEENKQYVVQVVDIINAQENLTKVKTLSGLNNK